MCFAIHGQYTDELKNKSIPRDKINYIQCWDIILYTFANPKVNVQDGFKTSSNVCSTRLSS